MAILQKCLGTFSSQTNTTQLLGVLYLILMFFVSHVNLLHIQSPPTPKMIADADCLISSTFRERLDS